MNNNNDISFSKLHTYIFDRNYGRVVLCIVNAIYAFDFIAVVLSEKGGKVHQLINVKLI